ncbi:hypothetical protein JCM8547_002519 [Rhodosporidiobolus lusitaniae]
MPNVSWILNKVILISTSLLLGSFYVHWLVDHPSIWRGPEIAPAQVASSLQYYTFVFHAPPFYVATLTSVAGLALAAATGKLILSPVNGLLFDGATLLLLVSAFSVYTSNLLAALRYLPLSSLPPGSPASTTAALIEKTSTGLTGALSNLGEVRLVEALRVVAASHMIIAVSLTGVLALQGAQGWADRPSRSPPAGVVPASTTAPVPVHGEKEPEKGLH